MERHAVCDIRDSLERCYFRKDCLRCEVNIVILVNTAVASWWHVLYRQCIGRYGHRCEAMSEVYGC